MAKRALKDKLQSLRRISPEKQAERGNAAAVEFEQKNRNWRYVLQMALLVLLLLLGMLGSFVFGFNPFRQSPRYDEPVKSEFSHVPAPAAPVGDQRTGERFSAVLSFLNLDKTRLFSVPTEIELSGDETRPEAVIRALLSGPGDTSKMLPILPAGTELMSIEISRGVATVVLSTEALIVEQEDRFKAWYAITNTLTEMQDIQNVIVLIDGRQPGFNDLPLNPLTRFSGDLKQAWRQRLSEDERFLDPDQDNKAQTHNVVLYFAAYGSAYLLPEIHQNIQSSDGNYIEPVLQALLKGPVQTQSLLRVLPSGAKVGAEILSEPEGKVLRINFDEATGEAINGGDDAILTYAAIVHTFSGFVPGIESVQFEIGGAPLGQVGGLELEKGRMRRGDVDTLIGRQVTLYFKDEAGTTLIPVKKTVGQRAALAPRTLIHELIEGPRGLNLAARAVFPAGISASDIIGVRLAEEGQMLVNLSRHFANQCAQLTAEQERALVFSIVNTLTEQKTVRRVRFYIDGMEIESLAGHLYMRGFFLRNTGIIKTS